MEKYEITVNGEIFHVTLKEVTSFDDQTDLEKSELNKADELANEVKLSSEKALASTKFNIKMNPIKAPIAGTIFEIKVNQGQEVKQGDTLIVLEAMKMENEIVAPHEGVVQEIFVASGQFVESKEVLLTLK